MHSCGYFIVDFCFLYFVVGGNTAMDWQTYAHHLLAAVTYYQTLYFMDFMCVFGCMILFIEISTPFVNIRWLLFTHKMSTSIWYAINALMMFISFLLGRVVYQTYIIFWFGVDWVYAEYMKKNLTAYQATVITEMALMVLLSLVLNSYWMFLMVKMIWRVISRTLNPPPKQDPIEKVELVKADGLA